MIDNGGTAALATFKLSVLEAAAGELSESRTEALMV
jgi:hypothetical protein